MMLQAYHLLWNFQHTMDSYNMLASKTQLKLSFVILWEIQLKLVPKFLKV
jgi:hypothetical protein